MRIDERNNEKRVGAGKEKRVGRSKRHGDRDGARISTQSYL